MGTGRAHAKQEHDFGAGEQSGSRDPHPGKRIEPGQPYLSRAPEFERGRFQAEQRIVLAILVRVDGVVADGPGDGSRHRERTAAHSSRPSTAA